MPCQIEQTLVISTCHLPKSCSQDLHENINNCYELEVGFLLLTSAHTIWDIDDNLTDNELYVIRAICKLANEHKCKWIRFDCDGQEIEELQSFEW